MLAHRQMRLDELAGFCERVPVLRDLNRRYLGWAPGALADWLVAELVRAGAAAVDGEYLRASPGK